MALQALHNTHAPFSLLLSAALSLAGCGGGGGDGAPRTPETVVFMADKDSDDVTELYAVKDDGSGLRKLSGSMVSGGDVVYFKLSPDATRVAYSADQDTDGIIELYVVDVDGGNRIKVSQGLGADADVYHGYSSDAFWWSPDGTRLVYLADADIDEIQELFLVNADGSDHRKISGFVGAPSVRIGQASWSPDGRYVAYYVRALPQNRPPNYAGFAVDRIAINTHDTAAGGPNSVRVSGTILENVPDFVGNMAWAPDSSRIAYTSAENSYSVRELYFAIPGVSYTPPSQQVNVPLESGQSVATRFFWSDDSRYVLYAVAGNDPIGLYTHDTRDTTPRNGARISGDIVSGGRILTYAWSPDNSRIAYRAIQDSVQHAELYSALPGVADSALKVSGALVPGGDVTKFSWSPDSTRLAYIADQDTDNLFEAYTVAAAGGSATAKVSHANINNSDVEDVITWSPNGRLIAYKASGDQTGLYVTEPGDNSRARKVTGNGFPASTVFDYQPESDRYFNVVMPWTSDSRYLLFSAGDAASFPILSRLYRAAIDRNQATEINGNMVSDGRVARFDY